MKKAEIRVGGYYEAKVSGNLTRVRVDDIREQYDSFLRRDKTVYDVTNTRTGRKTRFHSAAKFRRALTQEETQAEYRGSVGQASY